MTTITCNLKIAGTTTALDGYIRVNVEYFFSTENTLYVPVYKDYPLVSGSASFELEPSDLAQVAYRFQIFQTVPDTETEDDEGNPVNIVNADNLIKNFTAIVPYSSTAINLVTLAEQSGVRYDAQDSSLLTLARYLQSSETFWNVLSQNVWNLKGAWDSSAFYKRGDVVIYDGSAYQYISAVASNTNLPTNISFWRLLVSKGDTGTGTDGNNAPYDVTWDGATDAPSRNAVYNIIQTLATSSQLDAYAPLVAPSLVNPILDTSSTLLANDNSSKLVSSSWVQDIATALRKSVVPVGASLVWYTTSAPQYWVLADGRTLSRTTYADLFALYGTTFNTGGELGTEFRLPDTRGCVVAGMDQMTALQGSANRIVAAWADIMGGRSGAETHTLSVAEIPSHNHAPASGSTPSFAVNVTSGGTAGLAAGNTVIANNATNSTGGGGAHNNIQPTIVACYIIYAGI